MLEKPDLPDDLLISAVEREYGLQVDRLVFLPVGADANTAVYRLETAAGQVCFLKLRKGPFDEITVTLPRFLSEQGLQAVIPPLATISGRLWGSVGDDKILLYAYHEGKDAYQVELSPAQWATFGAALSSIHSMQLPQALMAQLPRETFSPAWRESVLAFLSAVEGASYRDPVADQLAAFMRQQRDEIRQLVERAEALSGELRARSLEFVLCHSDIHPGNLLLQVDGELFIVDWDNPILAPKERDLMLLGGCSTWRSPSVMALFYGGYGPADIDQAALAYYRYERIIWDIAAYCEALLLTDEGGADRAQSYRYFTSNFLPGHEIELARAVDIA